MEEEYRIVNGIKLPPKRRIVLKQTKNLPGNERQTSAVEDHSVAGIGGLEENQSESIPSTIAQTPPATYETHPSWKSWRGRMSRGEYLIFCLVILPLITAGLSGGVFLGMIILGGMGVIGGLLILVVLSFYLEFVMICAQIRRFHDMGQSGLRYLAFCVGQVVCFATTFALVITLKGNWTLNWFFEEFRTTPLWLTSLYVIFGILNFVILGCLDGTHGPNKYGPDPKGFSRGSSKTGELANLAQTTKRLKELGAMKTAGLISESEYEEQRAQILRGS